MADKKKQGNQTKNAIRSIFGDINGELRDLIDAAVRHQWDTQQVVDRLVNTHYFRQSFPGLIEKNGTLANALTGEQGVSVSAQSLAGAIKNYRTALEKFSDISKTYGYKSFDKHELAQAIKSGTSADEFGARLEAIDQVNSNPALKQLWLDNLKKTGKRANEQDIYRAAAKVGDRGFMDLYEQTQYQYQLGLTKAEAKDLATGKGSVTGAATFQNVDQIVAAARQNLQTIGPELAAQGINAAKLVKVLNNPTAYTAEMEAIQQSLQARKGLFGQPVVGTYAQRGAAGGLSQYDQQGQAAYG